MNSENAQPPVRPYRVIPHTRPLYFHEGRLYCARFDRILSTEDYGQRFREEGRLGISIRLRPLIGASPLAQRVARAVVYRMRVLPDGGRVYIFRGGVYAQRAGDPDAALTYRVERGSRPVSLAADARGLVVFGEYWDNAERQAVRIFGSRDSGRTWDVVHAFGPGEVRHVHGISYDRWDDCFWICTGDYDDENRLLRASPDFRDVRPVRRGGQGNRFYSILVAEDRLITATDTPVEANHICLIDKRTGDLRRVAQIENTNFYLCRVGGDVFLSTNAEPSPVNDRSASYVWMGSPGGRWRRVLSFPVDIYDRLARLPGVPSGLFQYPRVFFPEGDNPGDTVVCQALGVRDYDGAMLCYDRAAWSP